MELQKYFQAIKNGWWIVALTILSALGMALALSYYATPMYRSEARLVIGPGAKILAAQEQTVVNSLLALDRRSIATTYAEILISERMLAAAAKDLHVDEAQLDLYERSAVVLPEANVLSLTVKGPNPEIAAALVNSLSHNAINYISELYVIFDLSLLDRAVVPIKPYAPTPVRDSVVAVFLGAVLGVVLSLVRGQLEEYISVHSFADLLRTDMHSMAYSRRYFSSMLESELKGARTETLSIGLVQLVGLRNVFLEMPPLVRQQILRRVVNVIRKELRNADVVARWGDASFAILFPEASDVATMRAMDSIKGVLTLPLEILETGENFSFR